MDDSSNFFNRYLFRAQEHLKGLSLVVAFWFLAGLIDISYRIMPDYDELDPAENLAISVPSIAKYRISGKVYDTYSSRLGGYVLEEIVQEKPSQILAITEDKDANTGSGSIYKFQLVAVFDSGDAFAVFRVDADGLKAARHEKLSVGDEIEEFRVESINNFEVVLVDKSGASSEWALFQNVNNDRDGMGISRAGLAK